MVTCICVQKFRDKNGKIIGYGLKDNSESDAICEVSSGNYKAYNLGSTNLDNFVSSNNIHAVSDELLNWEAGFGYFVTN